MCSVCAERRPLRIFAPSRHLKLVVGPVVAEERRRPCPKLWPAMPAAKKAEKAAVGYNQGKFYRRKRELTDDMLTEIQDSFDLFTSANESDDGPPKIDVEELVVVMRALGHEPDKLALKKLAQESDPENTGRLDFDGYLNIILNKLAERPSQGDLEKAFRLFDQGSKQHVDFNDLKRIAGQIGEVIDDEELMQMLREADSTGEGVVGQADFMKIVTSYGKHYDGEK